MEKGRYYAEKSFAFPLSLLTQFVSSMISLIFSKVKIFCICTLIDNMWVQCMETLDRFGPKQADRSLVNWGSVGFKKWEDQWFEVIEHQWAHLVQGLILRKTRGTKPNDLDQDQPCGQLSSNGFKKWHKGSRKKTVILWSGWP